MPRVIITVPEKNAQPYRFELDRKVVSFGRAADNDIVMDTESVSGKHVEMRRVEGGYVLADQGSTNGMKLKGRSMKHIVLNSGMEVEFGEVLFEFSLSPEELEVLEKEKGDEEDFKGPARLPPVPPRDEPPQRNKGNTRDLSKSEEWDEPSAEDSVEEGRARRNRSLFPGIPLGYFGRGTGLIILFVIAALIAAAIGFAIRHQQEKVEAISAPVESRATDSGNGGG